MYMYIYKYHFMANNFEQISAWQCPQNAHLTVLQQSYATKTPRWIGDHSQCMTSPGANSGGFAGSLWLLG